MRTDCLAFAYSVGKCLGGPDLTPIILDSMIDKWELVEDQVWAFEQDCEAAVNFLLEHFPQILEVLKTNDEFYEVIRQIRSQVIFASCLPSIALAHQVSLQLMPPYKGTMLATTQVTMPETLSSHIAANSYCLMFPKVTPLSLGASQDLLRADNAISKSGGIVSRPYSSGTDNMSLGSSSTISKSSETVYSRDHMYAQPSNTISKSSKNIIRLEHSREDHIVTGPSIKFFGRTAPVHAIWTTWSWGRITPSPMQVRLSPGCTTLQPRQKTQSWGPPTLTPIQTTQVLIMDTRPPMILPPPQLQSQDLLELPQRWQPQVSQWSILQLQALT